MSIQQLRIKNAFLIQPSLVKKLTCKAWLMHDKMGQTFLVKQNAAGITKRDITVDIDESKKCKLEGKNTQTKQKELLLLSLISSIIKEK